MHLFGSANWYDRNNGLDQGLGEVIDAPRTFDDGTAPALVPFARLVGSATCIENGMAAGDSIDPDNAVEQMPAACFVSPAAPIDRAWSDATQTRTCSVQFFYSTVIQWLYEADTASVTTAFNLFLGAGNSFRFHASTPTLPAWVIVRRDNRCIVVLSGTENYQQLALQAFYSLRGPVDRGAISTMPLWYDLATALHLDLVAAGVSATDSVLLVGHSYGGIGAVLLAIRYRLWSFSRELRTLTFGDPKIGDSRCSDLSETVSPTSIANAGDLVTVLPPNVDVLAPAATVLGMPALFAMTSWRPEGGRFLQQPGGALVPGGEATIGTAQLVSYIQGALALQPIAVIVQHSIMVYRQRILERCPNREAPIGVVLWNFLHGLLLPQYFANDYFGADYFGDDYYY